jgi:hypothetical protein
MKDVGTRDQKLDRVAELVGRTVATTKNLTKAEASKVIDHYQPAGSEPQ